GDVGNIVLRDRKVMAEEGIVLVVVPVDARTSQLAGEPDIVSRGFVFEKESEGLLNGAKNVVKSVLADHPDSILDWRFTRRHIEENLERYFYEETQRRPMVLPVIVEV
ncbi:MAG: Zn-dependent hydrolase beta-lactamase superfamily, partial [Candidatus Daviesbacteria bacterium GW2011_GWA2_42_7]